MKKLLIILIVTFVSCKKTETIVVTKPKSIEKLIERTKIIKKTIGSYISDGEDIFWNAKQNDSSSYWVRINFQKEFAVYQFHGQCLYWFFTYNSSPKSKKITMIWSYKTDCLLDMKFLNDDNGVKKYPRTGDYFCDYSLVNDTIIKVEYRFPEWIKAVNDKAKDSIFPTYLYLQEEK